jgi:hypothetical protein
VTLTRGALIFLGYTLLAVLITHPLIWHLSTHVPHDVGDPLLSTYILWWNAHHLPLTADWWNAPFCWPATGTLALSDHRLGESLIASPLQWMGLGPLTAYNITLMLMFPLCATAAHWFAYTLTRRHDAALIAGLAYGFNPYRFGHTEHVELLASFGLPVALGALHHYLEDRRVTWIVLFGVALYLQALASSYYFLFFLVMLAMWIAWFVRRPQLYVVRGVAIAGVVIGIALLPIAIGYSRIHEQYHLARSLGDIVILSADVTSWVTGPELSWLWGWTSYLNEPEREVFPGLTIVVLVAIAVINAMRERGHSGGNRWSWILLGVAVVFAAIAASGFVFEAWKFGPVSLRKPFKPFSIAFYAGIGAVVCSSWVREAFRRRSVFAFYVLAAVGLLIFSLGPKPHLFQKQILYESPYAWLMRLTVFRDSVRVPARFAMLVILSLSAAGALGFARMMARRAAAAGSAVAMGLVAIVWAGLLADAWITPLPLEIPPAPWPAAVQTAGVGSFVELPLGDAMPDIAAMYRSMLNGVPTLNGASGYPPPHYGTLIAALDEMDSSFFDSFAVSKPMMVVVSRGAKDWDKRLAWLSADPRATRVFENGDNVWFKVQGRALAREVKACGGSGSGAGATAGAGASVIKIAALRDGKGGVDPAFASDGNDDTYWTTGESQQVGDALTIDLGQTARPCGVELMLGSRPPLYPRKLNIATSEDGVTWRDGGSERFAGEAVRSSLERPRKAVISVPLPDAPARFIRLRIEETQPKVGWLVSEITVNASAAAAR